MPCGSIACAENLSGNVEQLFDAIGLFSLAIVLFQEGDSQSRRTSEQPITPIRISCIITVSMYNSNAPFLRVKRTTPIRGVKSVCGYVTGSVKGVDFLKNASSEKKRILIYTEYTQIIHYQI